MRESLQPERDFTSQRDLLIRRHEAAHTAYYRSEVFGGPSLYFHKRALNSAGVSLDAFAESAYAVLASWGMHRMGPGGSKMCEFAEFKASLAPLWPTITALRSAAPESLGPGDWRDLSRVFVGLRCMASRTALVGNSKVMSHALPRLIPPVDREYTLKFLFGTGRIVNDLEREWQMLQTILRGFFYPVLASQLLRAKFDEWMRESEVFRWDTSPLKIVDNLIIGLAKLG